MLFMRDLTTRSRVLLLVTVVSALVIAYNLISIDCLPRLKLASTWVVSGSGRQAWPRSTTSRACWI